MSFLSLWFLIFLLATVMAYYLLPLKYRWLALLICSYVFYCWGGLKTVGYLVFTTFSIWGGALWMQKVSENGKLLLKQYKDRLTTEEKKKLKHGIKSKRRTIFLIVLIVNLGILAVIKYFNFTTANFCALWNTISGTIGKPIELNLLIPMGVSFYTFQAIGYLIDVYNEKYAAERSAGKFALFISFFPQIMQGPIARYDQLAAQLTGENRLKEENIKHGAILMLWGYFKKMVIADRMLPLVSTVFSDPQSYGGCVIVFGVLFYAFQLYADFSGGIDIVTGAAQMFNIQLAKNFRCPYFATSLGDFWRRWHISLGAWMRDYIFYPFATSKFMLKTSNALKKFSPHLSRTIPAVMGNILVFFIVGIWHGAQWSYILWGLYNGMVLAASTLLEPTYKTFHTCFPRLSKTWIWHLFVVIRTFVIVCVGYYFDRCLQIGDAFLMLQKTFTNPWIGQLTDGTLLKLGLGQSDFIILGVALAVLLAVSVAQECGVEIRKWMDKRCILVRWGLLYMLIFFFIAFAIENPFSMEVFMYAAF